MRFWKPKPVNPTKVGIAVAAYLGDATPVKPQPYAALRCLVASFQAQTYPHWQMEVTHDGPATWDEAMAVFRECHADKRIETRTTAVRVQQFGHPHRQAAIKRLLDDGCEWVCLTNQDNYYVPVFLEALLHAAQSKKVPFVYCDFVRSHKQWKPWVAKPTKGELDLGGFLAHKSIVEKVSFDKHTFNGDGDYIERLVQAAKHRVEKVPAVLFTHN